MDGPLREFIVSRTPSTARSAKKPIMAYRELILSAYSVKPNFACSTLGTFLGSGSWWCRLIARFVVKETKEMVMKMRRMPLSSPALRARQTSLAILPFLQRTFSFALLALHTVALRRPSSLPHAPSRGAFARTVPRASLLRLTAALPAGAFALAETLRVRRMPVHFPTVIMSCILKYTHTHAHTQRERERETRVT